MSDVVSRKRISPVRKMLIENSENPKIVDDSGFVPLNVLISRFERSGELKQMYERLANPNSSIDKVVEDFSKLEECGDSLEVMAFAKQAMDKIKVSNPEAFNAFTSVPAGRNGTGKLAEELVKQL